jgi:hypothetical protein
VDALNECRADGAALTGTFDHKQATIDAFGLPLGLLAITETRVLTTEPQLASSPIA